MLQDSQDWDDVLGKSDSLTEGVKAAANIKLRPAGAAVTTSDSAIEGGGWVGRVTTLHET